MQTKCKANVKQPCKANRDNTLLLHCSEYYYLPCIIFFFTFVLCEILTIFLYIFTLLRGSQCSHVYRICIKGMKDMHIFCTELGVHMWMYKENRTQVKCISKDGKILAPVEVWYYFSLPRYGHLGMPTWK